MIFKKIIPLLLAMAVVFVGGAAYGAAPEPTITVNGTTRLVTVSGATMQYPGTKISISVWYPDFLPSVATDSKIAMQNAFIDESIVDADKQYTASFVLKDSDPSGRYTMYVYIPGEDAPTGYTFDYRNEVKAESICSTIKNGEISPGVAITVNNVRNILDDGISHISVTAFESYRDYDDAAKTYVAEYVFNSVVNDLSQLTDTVNTAVEKINTIAELAVSDRENIKRIIESKTDLLGISPEDKVVYDGLTDYQMEEFIVKMVDIVPGLRFPEQVRKAVNDVLADVTEPEPEPEYSKPKPSTGGGGGGGGGGRGVKFDNTVEVPAYEAIPEPEPKFKDIEGYDWAKEAIVVLANKGIINGKTSDGFFPGDNIKREELIRLIVDGFNLKAVSASAFPFKDAEEAAWYYDSIVTAYELGITSGVSEDKFGVGETVTRQDLAVFLFRVLNYTGASLEKTNPDVEFADKENISEYAAEAIKELSKSGMLNGKNGGIFDPLGKATRAEVAKVIYSMMYRLNMI